MKMKKFRFTRDYTRISIGSTTYDVEAGSELEAKQILEQSVDTLKLDKYVSDYYESDGIEVYERDGEETGFINVDNYSKIREYIIDRRSYNDMVRLYEDLRWSGASGQELSDITHSIMCDIEFKEDEEEYEDMLNGFIDALVGFCCHSYVLHPSKFK